VTNAEELKILITFFEGLNEMHYKCLNSDYQYFIIGCVLDYGLTRNILQIYNLITFVEQENLYLYRNHNLVNVPYTAVI